MTCQTTTEKKAKFTTTFCSNNNITKEEVSKAVNTKEVMNRIIIFILIISQTTRAFVAIDSSCAVPNVSSTVSSTVSSQHRHLESFADDVKKVVKELRPFDIDPSINGK
jgi:hypothetical protein